jgi:8-oxo-dGTP diphosphatase
MIRVRHRYEDCDVLLDVRFVTEYTGQPEGREGQRLDWVKPEALSKRNMPAADVPINNAVRLPDRYMITGDYKQDTQHYLAKLKAALQGGIRLVQMREKIITKNEYLDLAAEVVSLCHEHNADVLLNTDAELAENLGADGVHLDSQRLKQLQSRPPLPGKFWVAASCHNARELDHAANLGLDFAVLSPVLKTPSHPDVDPIGWDAFQTLTEAVNLPVYALGGMKKTHLATAFQHGAQGIAAISAFWGAHD